MSAQFTNTASGAPVHARASLEKRASSQLIWSVLICSFIEAVLYGEWIFDKHILSDSNLLGTPYRDSAYVSNTTLGRVLINPPRCSLWVQAGNNCYIELLHRIATSCSIELPHRIWILRKGVSAAHNQRSMDLVVPGRLSASRWLHGP
jgi:hypothetical protein